jgi:hypothetical protein
MGSRSSSHQHEEQRMHAHEKIEVRNLTETRRRIDANRMLRPELPIAERTRRVAEYARQIEAYGEIVAWLPPAEPRTPAYRSRFADGDALRPRR